MECILPKNKDFSYDGLIWIFLMIFLSMLSLSMLTKDTQKQYGAVSFGVFPAFNATDSQSRIFDQHRLHGQLSAIIVMDQVLPQDISLYLHKLSQSTSIGKKHLKNLVLANHINTGSSDRWVKYLTLNETEFRKINNWRRGVFKDGIILVDQNGVIRGVFDLEDKLERLNFEGAVRGIL